MSALRSVGALFRRTATVNFARQQPVRFAGDHTAPHNDKEPTVPEEWEILGGQNDQQMVVDTDNMVGKKEALVGVLAFFAVMAGVGYLAVESNPRANKPSAARVLPYDGAYAALGGDPEKAVPAKGMYHYKNQHE